MKTGETLRDYAFQVKLDPSLWEPKSGEESCYRVRFVLAAASVPKDNTKGEQRYFFPRADSLRLDAASRELALPFEYRAPTEEEIKRYRKTEKGAAPDQENILAAAAEAVLGALTDEGLRTALAGDQRTEQQRKDGKPELPLLLKRMRHFARRNTSDFFVHKDLRGFLRRELEFFVKDHVLHLEDLEGDFEAKRRVIRVLRRMGEQVIEFLAQVEDAQKRLFEKKKFVLGTDYLIPVQHVPGGFRKDLLGNEAQIQQWRDWFSIAPERNLLNQTGEINERFLEDHPTLVVDTRHFGRGWTQRLLEALPFEDLDEATDGLLIHSENYQALSLLQEACRNSIDYLFIDPPYNTGVDGFVYKDTYQHASWLSMAESRLSRSRSLMKPEGLVAITIDFVEVANLRLLCDHVFGAENFLADIAWEKRYTRSNNAKRFYSQKDTVMCYRVSPKLEILRERRTEESKQNYSNPDNDERGPWISSSYVNPARREERPNLVYKIKNPSTGAEIEHPTHAWKYDRQTHEEHVREDRLYWGLDGGYELPRLKTFLRDASEGMVPVDVWKYKDTGTTDDGGNCVKSLFGEAVFDNPKPPRLVERIALLENGPTERPVVLDYFAGSGTTGHAVINLNRDGGGQRKFILVEMGGYFDTVLVPRIAKVMFSPEWKDGKPKRMATPEEAERTPRIVKVLRLESYEDALHNLAAPSTQSKAADREEALRDAVGEDEFRLRYLVELPLQAADTMLDVARLEHPFDYTLEVLTDDGPKSKPVDLVETFNWLYGLRPRRFASWVNPEDRTEREPESRSYRAVLATDREQKKRILVVWRDMTDLDPEVDRAFLESQVKGLEEKGETFDEMLVNGDTAATGFASLDGLFKQLMMSGEEAGT